MTNKERDELLIKMFNKMNNSSIEIKGLKDDVQGLKNDMKKIEKRMDKIEDEQRNLSRTVAKIEYGHGNKLQAILDVLCGQQQKNEEFEKKFNEHDKILSKHGDEIFYLKEEIG